MSDLSDIVVKLWNVADGLQDLLRRDDVVGEPLRLQIEGLQQRIVPIIHELERYQHTELMQQHTSQDNRI